MKNLSPMITVLLSFTLASASFAYVNTGTITPPTDSLAEAQTQNPAIITREAANEKIVVNKSNGEEKNCRQLLNDVEAAKDKCEEDVKRMHVERMKSCPTNPTVRSTGVDLGIAKVGAQVAYKENCQPLAEAQLGEEEANCKFSASQTRATIGPCL